MAVKTYDRFWNDKDGKEYGLIGQSTTNDTKGVALQVDEATGELLVKTGTGSIVTVEQSDPTKLKCTETNSADILKRIGGTVEYKSAAVESVASLPAGACVVNGGFVYNASLAPLYLVARDAVAAPVGGEAVFPLGEVAAGDTVPWPGRFGFTLGAHACLSTTRDTYTAPGAAAGFFDLWVE